MQITYALSHVPVLLRPLCIVNASANIHQHYMHMHIICTRVLRACVCALWADRMAINRASHRAYCTREHAT